MESEEFYCLWLSTLSGIGPVLAHKLLTKYGSATNIFQNKNDIEIIAKVPNMQSSHSEVERIAEVCKAQNIVLLTYGGKYYQCDWNAYVDFPIVLFVKTKELFDLSPCIGIVGSRRCTEDGKQKAITICKKALNEEYCIISGMAKGIDAYAHTACIKNNGRTIAVLGNGVDICYPSEHRYLYDAISSHGMLISEYPPGIRPSRYNFPRRNRIIAGMSEKIYVIEAGKKSGTISTVVAAKKYGRGVIKVNCYGQCE